MNLRDLLMRFYFKDKWRTKEQDSISTAVHPGPELSSSRRPRAVRRGPPQGPPVPQKPGLPSPATPLHSPHAAASFASPQGTDSSTAQLLPASSSWLAGHFPEPISKRSIEIAHGQVPGIVLNTLFFFFFFGTEYNLMVNQILSSVQSPQIIAHHCARHWIPRSTLSASLSFCLFAVRCKHAFMVQVWATTKSQDIKYFGCDGNFR